MGTIEIISASAGSGKTWTLAKRLEEAIASGRARPEAIVATTFTRKAAAELRQRVRDFLIRAGRGTEAQRLSMARIGTVHSVCGALLQDFAFEMGLSPDLRVLDEAGAQAELKLAMSRVLDPDLADAAAMLGARMTGWSLGNPVRAVIDLARANGIEAADLAISATKSLDSLRPLLGTPATDGASMDAGLIEASTAFLATVAPMTGLKNTSLDAIREAIALHARLARGESLPWSDWRKLQVLSTAKDIAGVIRPLQEAASAHDTHPLRNADCEAAVRMVFEAAAKALVVYQDHKREAGLLDFADQEMLARQLLERADVRERLEGELDLVLVDEFQDTSPLQLSLFLKLADLARHSIWVGDQKQAIYGFRGTDPRLMDAVLRQLGTRHAVTHLSRSWRSLPALVRQTSDMFAAGLAADGIPDDHVRLTAATAAPPEGHGPVVEAWKLTARSQAGALDGLATGLHDLLDRGEQIRDPATGAIRALLPRDVAVLLRKNDQCRLLADALVRLGIPARVSRTGLLATHEASLVLAGLALWADPKDSLAAAELGRLTHHAGDASAWLGAVLGRTGSPFPDLVAPLVEAREAHPMAGPVVAFDIICAVLDVREWCLAWGRGEERLANVQQLRAHAAKYAAAAGGNQGRTPAGLLAWLRKLARDGMDDQAASPSHEAVAITTWHKAKGLEWPFVVLADFGKPKASGLGVGVETAGGEPDLRDPLSGRWIRYWPYPYDARQSTPFKDRVEASPVGVEAREAAGREARRIAYVGWTRARDRVVLAGRAPTAGGSVTFGCLDQLPGALAPTGDDALAVLGLPDPVPFPTVSAREIPPPSPVPAEAAVARGVRAYPPAFLRPSGQTGSAEIEDAGPIGGRMEVRGNPDQASLGQAIHACLAADRPDWAMDRRLALANRTLGRWQVDGAVQAADLVAASDNLFSWIAGRWPTAKWHREWPITMREPSGSILRGACDLALDTPAGWIVIDHKSFPGSKDQAVARAAAHAGQLEAYGRALAMATDKPFAGAYVHLPTGGTIFGVLLPDTGTPKRL